MPIHDIEYEVVLMDTFVFYLLRLKSVCKEFSNYYNPDLKTMILCSLYLSNQNVYSLLGNDCTTCK